MTIKPGLKQKLAKSCFKIILIATFAFFTIYAGEVSGAARRAIVLCLNIVIPSLFPFFVLTQLFIKWGLGHSLGIVFSPVAGVLFRQRGICLVPFLLSILSGYPVGVHSIVTLYQDQLCTKEEAHFMLSFCSNCGPAFLMGAVGIGFFQNPSLGWALYICHVFCALLTGLILSFLPAFSPKNKTHIKKMPTGTAGPVSILPSFLNTVSDSFMQALHVSAFIIFFCVVIHLLEIAGITGIIAGFFYRVFPLFPLEALRAAFAGFIEMTRGTELASLFPNFAISVLLASGLCAFSGLSIHFQVLFLLKDVPLKKWPYFLGKTLHTVLCIITTCFALRKNWLPFSLPAFSSTGPEHHFSHWHVGGLSALLCLLLFAVAFIFRCLQHKKRR